MITMRTDFYYDSCGAGKIRAAMWTPAGQPKVIVQLVHGIVEHIDRYDHFANYLNSHDILVVAEDHMGHGGSVGSDGIAGYFHGGWFCAVEDTCTLIRRIKEEYPHIPYILFGHSMGSFVARSILGKYPDIGLDGCVICGTAWQPTAVLKAGVAISKLICKTSGETNPNAMLENIVFGSYNHGIEHPRTKYDWLSRDTKIVDDYIVDPLCGFSVTAGLLRDMLEGICYIQNRDTIKRMQKDLPVLFIAGGDDPVGAFGKGVEKAVHVFQQYGMQRVSCRIFPLCRHEILNEINRDEIYEFVCDWIMDRFQEEK